MSEVIKYAYSPKLLWPLVATVFFGCITVLQLLQYNTYTSSQAVEAIFYLGIIGVATALCFLSALQAVYGYVHFRDNQLVIHPEYFIVPKTLFSPVKVLSSYFNDLKTFKGATDRLMSLLEKNGCPSIIDNGPKFSAEPLPRTRPIFWVLLVVIIILCIFIFSAP